MEKPVRESLLIMGMCSLVVNQQSSKVKVLLVLVSLLLGATSRSCVRMLALLL